MTDINEIMNDIAKKTEEEKEKIRRDAEEKARREAELKKQEEDRKRQEAEQERVKREFNRGEYSLNPEVYESYLKAGYKPTPESMHSALSIKHPGVKRIAYRFDWQLYEKLKHPCFSEIVKLASEYGMRKEQFNELLGVATSPEAIDALVEAGADVKKFPMEDMMLVYGLATGKETFFISGGKYHDDVERFNPNDEVARDIRKTIKKVLELGFDTKEVAKILSKGDDVSELMQACLNEIKRDDMLEKAEKIFRIEQAKLTEEGKEKGVLSFDDRMKKLEDSSMSMYDKGDEEIVVPFSILKGKGGIVLKNTPENKELVEAYLSRHKIALKTSLHINQFVKDMKKNGIEAEVCSQKDLKERYGENVGEMTPGKLEVKVPEDKIQKFIKLKEGDIYQTSSERPTLAKAPKGGVILTKDGNFDEMPKNMVVKEKTTSTVLQAERDL
jgi:hypothetical protein